MYLHTNTVDTLAYTTRHLSILLLLLSISLPFSLSLSLLLPSLLLLPLFQSLLLSPSRLFRMISRVWGGAGGKRQVQPSSEASMKKKGVKSNH